MVVAGIKMGKDSKKGVAKRDFDHAINAINKNISGTVSTEVGEYSRRNSKIVHAQSSNRGHLGFISPQGRSIPSLRRYIEKCETWLGSHSNPSDAIQIIDAVHASACSKNEGKLPQKDTPCYRKFLEEVCKRLTAKVNSVIEIKIREVAGTSENIIVYEGLNLAGHKKQNGLKEFTLSVLPRNILDECRVIDEIITSFKRI